ncbi:MAG: hypothetical protein M0R28_11910 [Pigmentiphaga sp.]|nr:hypothetical protein [Pigmentiphaga sp.]
MLGLAMAMAVSAGLGLAQEQVPAQERQREAAQAWEGQRERVLELLLEDTRRAFESGLQPSGGGAVVAPPPPASPAPPALRLLALYGVEPHYTLVLDVDGQVRTYRPGATLPLERPDPAREYRLLKVADRCAVLRRAGQGARTVCHAPRFAGEAATPVPSLAGPLPWPMR